MMQVRSNKMGIEELKPGDHIYSWRSIIYFHHGIYVGDHKVIHFTSSGGSSTTSSSPHIIVCSACQYCADALHQLPMHQTQAPSQGGVIISCLDTFLNGGGLCRYAYSLSAEDFLAQARGGTGTTAHSDPPNDVLHRFLLKANDFGTYILFKNNCEDFAIYCKTSLVKKRATISRSGQIKTLIASIFGGGNIVGAGFSGMVVGSILGGGGIPTPINLRSNYLYQSDIAINRDYVKVPVERLVEYIRFYPRRQFLYTQQLHLVISTQEAALFNYNALFCIVNV